MNPQDLRKMIEKKREENAREHEKGIANIDLGALAPSLIAYHKFKAGHDSILDDLLMAVEALGLRTHHDEDCADATEKFAPHEMCECGASVARETLQKIYAKFKGEG